MSPRSHNLPHSDDGDFEYEQIKRLATVEVLNPNTGQYELCIDQHLMYRGNSFNMGEKDAPSFPLYSRYSRLKQALENPGLAGEAAVPAPMQNGIILCNSPETFDRISKDPKYPYRRWDIGIIKQYHQLFAELINLCNFLEPCGGFGEKLALMLSLSSHYKSRPKRIIINDTEQTNLDYALTNLSELLGLFSSTPEVMGICGDWLEQSTYLLKNKKSNFLKIFRTDTTHTVVFLPGAMANNFRPVSMFEFLEKNFKKGTIFIIGYDCNVDCDLLRNYYKGNPQLGTHPLVQQLALNGITHACWENLEYQADLFDPRKIAVSVDAVPWTDMGANVRISFSSKKQPDRRVLVTPIFKASEVFFKDILDACGFDLVGSLFPPPQMEATRPTKYGLHFFTHKGYAEKFRGIFKKHKPKQPDLAA